MGGVGSGPDRNPARAKLCTEDVPALDVLQLSKAGVLDSNGTGELRYGDSSVAFRVGDGELELAFTVVCGVAVVSEARQEIVLEDTTPPFGGVRLWFLCPRCRVKRTKLYLRGTTFACRRCQGLTYRSAQRHDARVDALRRDQDHLADVLTGKVAVDLTERSLAMKAAMKGPLLRVCA